MLIAGVDEAGRGPLAGPVVAAAVILEKPIVGVMDSKALSPAKRSELSVLIQQHAVDYAYGRCEAEEIDRLNIHHATLLAMRRAIDGLKYRPEFILVDGLYCPETNIKSRAIVKGDSLEPSISAASILAKVKRDEEMIQLDSIYPDYGFATHKGYPTPVHRLALQNHGPCPVHRMSFRPVVKALKTTQS